MKIMRMAMGRGKSHLNVSELLENVFNIIENTTNYALIFGEDHLRNLTSEVDYTSMIPWCEIKGGLDGSCTLFEPVITDQGICHAFNPTPSLEMLTPSYFSHSFKEAFKSDFSKEPMTYKGTGNGKEHALTFYLLNTSFRRMLQPSYSFSLKLSTTADYFDMKHANEAIKFGYHTTLKVDAMEIISSNDLRKVSIEKRKCRFSDEVDGMDIFKVYSKSGCEFECKVKEAAKICHCYPWYVPAAVPTLIRHNICDIDGNYCFDSVMKKKDVRKMCTCLPTCHHIEFPFVSYTRKLDSVAECKDRESKEYKLARIMMAHGFDSFSYKEITFMRYTATENDYEEWDKHKNTIKLCNKMMKFVAKVTVMFDRNTYIRTQKSVKMTFTDKLAAFGKFEICR